MEGVSIQGTIGVRDPYLDWPVDSEHNRKLPFANGLQSIGAPGAGIVAFLRGARPRLLADNFPRAFEVSRSSRVADAIPKRDRGTSPNAP